MNEIHKVFICQSYSLFRIIGIDPVMAALYARAERNF